MATRADEEAGDRLFHLDRQQVEKAAGAIFSLLVHVLAALLLYLFLTAPKPQPSESAATRPSLIMIQIGNRGAATKSAPLPPARIHRPHPARTRARLPPALKPTDNLQAKLRALSHLRAPQSASTAISAQPGEGGSGEGAYGVRDLIKTQVLRHWSVDFALLRGQNLDVRIRVVMTGAGTILSAEIVDQERYKADRAYRELALSARNAVLLSSPVVMTAGPHPARMEFVLNLNPEDAVQ